MIDYVWTELNHEIEERKANEAASRVKTERAGESFSFPISTLADAPLAADGMMIYAVRFISDGRKGGEGAGTGTGLPAWYNPATDSWLTFHDNSSVLV